MLERKIVVILCATFFFFLPAICCNTFSLQKRKKMTWFSLMERIQFPVWRVGMRDPFLCLKCSPGQGLFLSSNSTLQLKGFCYSDWATCPMMTWCSTIGSMFYSWLLYIAWGFSTHAKQGNVVSLSLLFNRSGISCHGHHELWTHLVTLPSPWLLGVSHLQPVILFCENQPPLHIAANPFFQEWMKHIEPDCHIIHEKLQSGLIHTGYFPTTQLPAYVFTRPLGKHTISFSSPSLQVGCSWFSQFNLRAEC